MPVFGILTRMETVPFEFAKEDYPLAPLTLYNVGGPARVALFPCTDDEACQACEWMFGQEGRKLVLGRGSNVLVSDRGFPGIVLVTTGLSRIQALGDDRFRAGGGAELDRLVCEVMVPNNYAGVGALTGIPGSVGGAIYMNAGTVNGSTCELLESVDVIGPEGRRTVAMAPSLYGYRSQTFCSPETLILSGVFRFNPSDEDQQAVYDHYTSRRLDKQPQGRCCGSVFKNPKDDHAGRLIEACGLKGLRHGGAMVSPQHANFIMNEDAATFDDIRWLIDHCRGRVLEEFGVALETEVAIIE